MACLFGHKWDGCKCKKCGRIRDEQHERDFLCKGECKRCGKRCKIQHDLEGCKCKNCGSEKHDHRYAPDKCRYVCSKCGDSPALEKHDWNKCICRVCGKQLGLSDYSHHTWESVSGVCGKERCSVCGLENDSALVHNWNKCTCLTCGKTRNEEYWHDFIPQNKEEPCKEVCSVCGKKRISTLSVVHKWVYAGQCRKKCSVCGTTEEDHDCDVRTEYSGTETEITRRDYHKCKRCGKEWVH
ncbi:MAG: hypothetical protein FWG72_02905 [Oscillospiraceae bacterium]|nr:hypothetical protein [Oscillospiraceae bacterium]